MGAEVGGGGREDGRLATSQLPFSVQYSLDHRDVGEDGKDPEDGDHPIEEGTKGK